MAIKLPRLASNETITREGGYPTNVFQRWWQVVADTLENALNDILIALELAGIAVDIADGIQTDIDEVKASAVALLMPTAKFPNGRTITSTTTIGMVDGGAGSIVSFNFTGTTDNVPEGANLYHTTARARSSLSDGAGIAYNSTTGVISVDPAGTYGTPTGTLSRATFATYTAPVITPVPTQAEVQDIADALQAVSQTLAALITDMEANGNLS